MNKKMNVFMVENELAGASAFFPTRPTPVPLQKPEETQIVAQKVEQVSNPVSKELSKSKTLSSNTVVGERASVLPTTEAIERLSFDLRKTTKTKVNTQVAEAWKQELDEIAFKLHVGKYELLEYIIGAFLGKVSPRKGNA